jgi:hypothetical protein
MLLDARRTWIVVLLRFAEMQEIALTLGSIAVGWSAKNLHQVVLAVSVLFNLFVVRSALPRLRQCQGILFEELARGRRCGGNPRRSSLCVHLIRRGVSFIMRGE